MLHLLHPSLARAAALEPHRLRQGSLAAAAAMVAVTALLMNAVPAAIAEASESVEAVAPTTQLFAAASLDSAPVDLLEYTVDVRPALMYPVGAGAPLGSPFGPRSAPCAACSSNHTGIDWNPGRGFPIVAIADGVVSNIGPAGSSLGVWVAIDHVVNGQAVTSIYGHMEHGSLVHSIGQAVRVGDQVGRVGSTGVVTAPHLHFELHIGGGAVNPAPWLVANGAQ